MRRFKEFKITEDDGTFKEYKMYEPSFADHREAKKVHNTAFNDAIESDGMLRDELQRKLKEKGAWTDSQDVEYDEIGTKIASGTKRLAEGGFSLKEARKLAIEISVLRNKRRDLLMEISKLDNVTVEGQAENASFNYLVSACLVYNEGDKEVKYFSGLEDYLNRGNSEVATTAANTLAGLLYDIGTDAEKNLPENKFLLEYGFVNDELGFINKDGRKIDADGRLVDDDGRLINEDGKFVDINGELITADGEYIVDFKGFLDDSGEIVAVKKAEPEEPEDEKTAEIAE